MLALALGEITHRRLHQIKLLLQVVETDLGVEAVPVQQFVFRQHGRGEFTVDVLLVQDVEQRLEERYSTQHKSSYHIDVTDTYRRPRILEQSWSP